MKRWLVKAQRGRSYVWLDITVVALNAEDAEHEVAWKLGPTWQVHGVEEWDG